MSQGLFFIVIRLTPEEYAIKFSMTYFHKEGMHHSILTPDFLLGRMPGTTALGSLEITFILNSLWLHAKAEPGQVGDAITPSASWSTYG